MHELKQMFDDKKQKNKGNRGEKNKLFGNNFLVN